jgi:hypothetical protein
MKKIHVLGVALVAVLALSVVGAVSASAATLQWLANGKAITSALASETTGSITLGSTNGLKIKIEAVVLCSGKFDGTVGPGGEDEITKVLNLSGVEVTLAKPLTECENVKTCTSSEVSPVNLPWLTRLELSGTEAAPEFLDIIEQGAGGAEPGWEVVCKTSLGTVTETCTAPTTDSVLTNDTGESDVLGVFPTGSGRNTANCSVGGAGTGFLESSSTDEAGLSVLTSGEALSVSYE